MIQPERIKLVPELKAGMFLENDIEIASEFYGEEIVEISSKGANSPKSIIISEEVNSYIVISKSADTFRGGTGSHSNLFVRSSLTPQVIYGRNKNKQEKISSSKKSADYQKDSPVHSKVHQSVNEIIKCETQEAVKFNVQVDKVLEAMFTHWQEQTSQDEATLSKLEINVAVDGQDHNFRHAAACNSTPST
jgi:hypothetical protein